MSADKAGEVPNDTVIWRYLTFEKMVSMLEYHSLWFARPFTLSDSWEGLYPPSYYRNSRECAVQESEDWDEFEDEFAKRWKRHRDAMFVNCWYVGDHESDAMWRLYGNGVAIQATVGGLRGCVSFHGCGAVGYYDPEKDVVYKSLFGKPDILHKRIGFGHEKEFRAWIVDDELVERIERNENFGEGSLSLGRPAGISDMPRLIQKVVVAPGAKDSFVRLVKDVCARYGKGWLSDRIEKSYLDRLPPTILYAGAAVS